MSRCRLTVLNSMAGGEFEPALDRHVQWGISVLDLKDRIFGKGVIELTDDEAGRAARLIRDRGLSVHCLSLGLFGSEVEAGKAEFADRDLGKVGRAIEIARILRPRFVRLLAAQTTKRAALTDSIAYLQCEQPAVIPMYREAIDRLADAGFGVTIENEIRGCIIASPGEARSFFAALDRPGKACFTWDVQNLWQMGTFPTMEVYAQLKDLIGYFHLKGGMSDGPGGALRWASSLEDASWPVVEIARRAIADGVSPAICLNPSHGARKEGYDYDGIVKRDLDFIRKAIPEVE